MKRKPREGRHYGKEKTGEGITRKSRGGKLIGRKTLWSIEGKGEDEKERDWKERTRQGELQKERGGCCEEMGKHGLFTPSLILFDRVYWLTGVNDSLLRRLYSPYRMLPHV